MKRYNNPFFSVEIGTDKKDRLPTYIFTMWIFRLLIFLWFIIGILLRITGGLFITPDEYLQNKKCTPSQSHQQIIEKLDLLIKDK